MDYDWPRTHATQPELQRYAEVVVDRFGLRPHFRFGTRVEELTWDESASGYRVRTDDGAERTFRFVINCAGLLNVPGTRTGRAWRTSAASPSTRPGGRTTT